MNPHFLIIGAQKAGTTAAIRNLALHPRVHTFCGATEYGQREIEFYNQHWDRGAEWYRGHFPSTDKVVGEKTAELLHRMICHERMRAVNPDFKLLVLLRSPVERAYSQWKMARYIKRDESEQFDDVVAQGVDEASLPDRRQAFYTCADTGRSCWREGYVLKGFYAEQLRSLCESFPRNQIHVVISERIRLRPDEHYAQIFRFLGLDAIPACFLDHFVTPTASPMSAAVRHLLHEFYAEPNRQLFQWLGEEIPEWTAK